MDRSVGPYRIEGELGRGGMGVVYRALDTRLDRVVAIKSLPAELASDPTRLERFQREARVLAQLNHPNLAGIHGVEEHEGGIYLVLEFVEGETLADRLDRGPLPVDEAIELAVQIAAGVEAAHDAGVIHRDLKPANVMVTPDGVAKVLDFGLARTDDGAQSSTGALDSPTMTNQPQHSPTIAGAILGTAAYMSPEQARGRRVDKRTDIWSFGVVLFEMLVGASPFHGETATDSIGAVLHKDLDLALLPSETPAHVRRVLSRCLVRDKNLRYRDIGDVRVELLTSSDTAERAHAAAASGSRGLLVGITTFGLICLGLAVAMWLRPPVSMQDSAERPAPLAFPITLLAGGEPSTRGRRNFALSPDGRQLVVSAIVDGEDGLWLRPLASDAAVLMPGTAGAESPVFSPDGRWIAFMTDTALWRVATAGGSPQRVAEVTSSHRGVSWVGNDRLVYAPNTTALLHLVSASGGTPETITTYESLDADRPHRSHRWPASTPDGRGVVFTAQTGGDTFNESAIAVVDLESGRTTKLLERAGSFPVVLPEGELLYTSGGTVYACLVDWSVPAVVGEPKPLLFGVWHNALNGSVQLAVADDGTALSIRGTQRSSALGMPTWLDLASGKRTPLIDEPTPAVTPRISPDGSRIVFCADVGSLDTGVGSSAGSLVIYELARGLRTEITLPRVPSNPVWSPDGREIAFSMSTEDSAEIPHIVSVDGESPPRPIVEASLYEQFVSDWSADGSRIHMTQWSSEGDWQLYVLKRDGDAWTPTPVLTTPAGEYAGILSPDGAWLAYGSSILGDHQLFIRRVDGPPDRRQISISGGGGHQWAPDGRALYYVDPDEEATGWERSRLMRVDLTEIDGRLEPSAPVEMHVMAHAGATGGRAMQHLHPDGTRMLYIAPAGDAQLQPSTQQAYLRTGLIDDIRRELGEAP